MKFGFKPITTLQEEYSIGKKPVDELHTVDMVDVKRIKSNFQPQHKAIELLELTISASRSCKLIVGENGETAAKFPPNMHILIVYL